jgi:cytoskeleton protein RodZ
MSDSDPSANSEARDVSAQAQGGNARSATTSAGTLLRQGRQAAGLHIAALAVSLKVPVHRLEALETDRFDLLPDAVFARALASSVCRVLKMDAAPVLAQLPLSPTPRLNVATARTHDSYVTGDSVRGLAAWRSLSMPVIASAAALVLAAAALVVWPMLQSSFRSAEVGAAAEMPPAPTDAQSAPGVDAPSAVSGQVQPAEVVTTVVPTSLPTSTDTSLAPVTASPPVTTQNTAAALPVAVAPLTPAAASSTSGIIVFSPSAASWVEVTDAKGTVVLRRMLAAGEVAGASGALPLSAVVGRADVTKVQVRGQAFDLSSIARENVARFEVK